MSGVALWISSVSLLLSAGSLVVSVAAYRGSMSRRRDRLSELSRDIADLRPRLDQLERTIPKAVPSRASAPAELGHRPRVGADTAAVRESRGRPEGAASMRKRVDYCGIETTKSVTSHQVGSRLEHLVQFMRDRARRPR